MPNQDFVQIAQKLRRLERIMGGLAADAEQKAILFDGLSDFRSAEHDEISWPGNGQPGLPNRRALGRLLLRLRNSRHDYLEPELFSNASWDILLTLFVEGEAGQKPLPAKTICEDAKIPLATGERWMNQLAEQGLIRTERDAPDPRAGLVALSEDGVTSMERYIDCAGAAIYGMFVDMRIDAEIDGELVQ